MMKIISALALLTTAHGASIKEASRRLQGAAATCSPSDAELLTLIEVVLAQNEKLTSQTSLISCLTSCQVSLDDVCACADMVNVPAPPGPPGPPPVGGGVTLQVDPAYAASLGGSAAFADCWLSAEEMASDPDAMILANIIRAQTAAATGVSLADVVITGLSTDGDDIPGCADGSSPPGGGGNVGGGLTLNVDPEYALTLGNDAAFADCYLSADEIASDPEAAAFVDIIRAQTAATTGVPIDQVIITGLSTDGDDIPGCNDGTAVFVPGITIQVTPEFTATLGSDAAFEDCFLTPEEIATDPEAAAFAAAFVSTVAAQMGVDPSFVSLNGISTDGDDVIGCDGAGPAPVGSGMVIQVSPDFAASMGDDAAFNDCWLTADEIASDPEASAFAAAFIASTAASLGVDPAAVSLNGISTRGLAGPGCGTSSAGVGSTTTIAVDPAFAAGLADGGGFDDCQLNPAEIAADAQASALAQVFRETQAAAMGVAVEDIVITGIEATSGQGCSQVPHAAAGMTVETTPEFVNSLGGPGFLDDCYISVEEYQSNANAQALVDAFIAAQAAQLGVDPSAIAVSGISTSGLDGPGCGTGRRMQTNDHLLVQFNPAHAAHMHARAFLATQNRFVTHIKLL